MTTATYSVDGMTCAHCVHHVTSEISALPGVSDVQIELVVGGSSPVTVTSDAPLDEAAVAAAVVEAGYALTPKHSLL
jgi:copper chaperone CopZ